MLDDFSSPGTATHMSAPGESRAVFPPGTTGGAIISLGGGSDIASDRGLFGSSNSLVAGTGTLDISIANGFVEFDWNVGGYDFHANGVSTVVWRDLTNLGVEDIPLSMELFQTFDGTTNNVGTGVIDIVLAAGETRDVVFSTVGGATDFVGFRLGNESAIAAFAGRLGSISAVPEPSSAMATGLGAFLFWRRRRAEVR